MTRAGLIELLALRIPGLVAKDSEISVKLILEAIGDALVRGNRAEVRGFGSFSLSYRSARTGRNPKSGDAVMVPAKHVPHFTVGKELRERVEEAVTVAADGKQLSLAGEMGFGTTNLVRAALGRHPGITGIELTSPGGSAAEGFALAELVRDRGLDTYVRADCASACVLVFAGGHERLAAPSARFGLHRSGVDWRRGDSGVSPTDLAMERFFRERGVADDFIARTLATPFRDIWVPSAGEVMASGLASGVWTLPGAPG